MTNKYTVLKKRILSTEYPYYHDIVYAEKGDIVYECKGYDYGLARDDTEVTKIYHISVTKNENGEYTSFTIPYCDLEKIK